ncbi:hypothetical protein FUA23_12685 [Neolewinella aurantiaca]|uniref:Uncharacterized protein n=1 Tax=Neolewinella aurantiaca TaxID=2602767 RepID=A0A5C7FDY9_9BACT|nr:hypothetical protein [Neolewinella aurantiaca]TXF88909.1 hypothetical protein FUA23_12685 [Neolewinella aurantiaca]
MDREQISTFFSISLGIITPFVASPLVYNWYFDTSDLSMVILFPLLVILLPSIAFLTVINLLNGWKWPLFGNLLFPVLTGTFCVASIGNKVLKDSPTILLHARYYNEEGFDLYLRENMTVKCKEHSWVSSNDKYGTYRLRNDTVFLQGINVQYGLSEVSDTLYFKEDKLVFRLDKEWRSVLESAMYIEENRLK